MDNDKHKKKRRKKKRPFVHGREEEERGQKLQRKNEGEVQVRLQDEPIKLTKQQKRDLKRNAKAKAAMKGGATVGVAFATGRNLSSSSASTSAGAVHEKTVVKPSVSAYKRETVYPSKPLMKPPPSSSGAFISPSWHPQYYRELLNTSYRGFVQTPSSSFEKSFHENFQASLLGLDKLNVYQYDITQPAGLGTKIAKTFVSRCLVGEPGVTYKYLGIRMFSIPWEASSVGASPHSIEIGKLNQKLIEHTKELLLNSGRKEFGSCKYNLTLINRCLPQSEATILKQEPLFKKDKITVSWHADSTLEHFSTIGVYHFIDDSFDPSVHPAAVAVGTSRGTKSSRDTGQKTMTENTPWKVAMRVWCDAEGPSAGNIKKKQASGTKLQDDLNASIPPISVPLPSGDTYFLLDDFNHHHQHSVLASSQGLRYSSTHRVCRTDGHTFSSIRAKCVNVFQRSSVNDLNSKLIRGDQFILSEIEFEWIRQFYIQGSEHKRIHEWWWGPMEELCGYWCEMEKKTKHILDMLEDASHGLHISNSNKKLNAFVDKSDPDYAKVRKERKQLAKRINRAAKVDISMYDVMEEVLRERASKRKGWKGREHEIQQLHELSKDCKPIDLPLFTKTFPSPLPCDELDVCADNVCKWKKTFEKLRAIPT